MIQNRRVRKFKAENRKAKYDNRIFNFCNLCSRRRAYIRKFGLCRICIRDYANKGLLPGVTKSSW